MNGVRMWIFEWAIVNRFLPSVTVVAKRLCFHKHLSFCPQNGRGQWQGGMNGRECAWQGACVAGGMHGGGMCGREACMAVGPCVAGGVLGRGVCMLGVCMAEGHSWQGGHAWTVCILLECILVNWFVMMTGPLLAWIQNLAVKHFTLEV